MGAGERVDTPANTEYGTSLAAGVSVIESTKAEARVDALHRSREGNENNEVYDSGSGSESSSGSISASGDSGTNSDKLGTRIEEMVTREASVVEQETVVGIEESTSETSDEDEGEDNDDKATMYWGEVPKTTVTAPVPPTRGLTATAPLPNSPLLPATFLSVPRNTVHSPPVPDSVPVVNTSLVAPIIESEQTRYCWYQCAGLKDEGCGELNRIRVGNHWGGMVGWQPNEPVRCKVCGCRVLYKVRTKRMVQFEAR